MNEMLSYVFGSLESNRREIQNLVRRGKHQNFNTFLLAVSGMLTLAALRKAKKDSDAKIKNLEEEIELLRGQKTDEMEG